MGGDAQEVADRQAGDVRAAAQGTWQCTPRSARRFNLFTVAPGGYARPSRWCTPSHPLLRRYRARGFYDTTGTFIEHDDAPIECATRHAATRRKSARERMRSDARGRL